MTGLEILRKSGLVLASGNLHKLQEFQNIFLPLGIAVRRPPLSIDVDESADTFEGNARLKADAFYDALQCPVLADDSGLCVDVLGGRPGVMSARYGGEGLTDKERRRKLLEELRDIPEARRGARFVCVLVLDLPVDGQVKRCIFRGETDGLILTSEAGQGGFGYDSIFFYPPLNRSFAELTEQEKNAVSHRGRAVSLMLQELALEA